MDFQELIRSRYSVRAYKPDPVPDAVLGSILEAGRLAPTAGNRQAFRILVIKTQGREAELKSIYGRDWFVQAPLILCVCGIPRDNWVRSHRKNYNDVDVAIVMDHMILAATDLGLGTCWIGAFNVRTARKVLGTPKKAEPIELMPLGYPADEPKPKKRKDIGDIVFHDRWSNA